MCRLLAAWAEGSRGLGVLAGLARLLHGAASMDPRLEAAYGGSSHCDGYGYVLLVDYGAGWEVHYHRFDAWGAAPGRGAACRVNLERLAGEVEVLAHRLSRAARAVLVLHARRASPGTPRGTLHAHPYHAALHAPDGPAELYLAQNGSVNREALAAQLGVDPEAYTDTHLLTQWIARRTAGGEDPLQALREGAKYTRTAYVTVLLYITATGRPRLLYAHHVPETLPQELREYYSSHIVKAPGLEALASPTIVDLARRERLPVHIEHPPTIGTLGVDRG